MDLFHFREESPGAVPLWHHKGWTLFRTLIELYEAKTKKGRI